MKKVLITGSKGLLGSAVVHVLKEYGDNYEIIEHSRDKCDLMNVEETQRYFSGIQDLDTVIHCAAEVGGGFEKYSLF